MSKLTQVEIRIGPSQFRSTAKTVRRVAANGVADHLKSKKENNQKKFKKKTKKTIKDNASTILIKQGKKPEWSNEQSDKGVLLFSYFRLPDL